MHFPYLLCFLSVILLHFIAHLLEACNIASFPFYLVHSRIFSHLQCFLSVSLSYSIAYLPRACDVGSSPSYCLNSSLFSSLPCFFSVSLFHFMNHLLGSCNIACFLFAACNLAHFHTYSFPFSNLEDIYL